MKAVIVGIEGRFAAALTEDGRVTRIRNRGYAIGQTIDSSLIAKASPLKKASGWAAAAAAALLVCFTGGYLYAAPYAYVSLDVNPSVEYVLNRFDRVLRATAVNEDASAILKDVKLTNKPIDTAVRETLGHIASAGYFEDTKPNGLVIAASCENEKASEKLALRLEQSAQEETGNLKADVAVAAVTVTQEKVEEAKILGVTPGKLDLVEQLKASAENPDSIDATLWLEQPVGEILNEIKASQQDQPPTSPGNPSSESSDLASGEISAEESSSVHTSKPDPGLSLPEEENWETSLPEESSEESSAESSETTSELADVQQPLGKPIRKPEHFPKGEEALGGAAERPAF